MLPVAGRCVVEMVRKDAHACNHHPERLTEWVKIAREEAERAVA